MISDIFTVQCTSNSHLIGILQWMLVFRLFPPQKFPWNCRKCVNIFEGGLGKRMTLCLCLKLASSMRTITARAAVTVAHTISRYVRLSQRSWKYVTMRVRLPDKHTSAEVGFLNSLHLFHTTYQPKWGDNLEQFISRYLLVCHNRRVKQM